MAGTNVESGDGVRSIGDNQDERVGVKIHGHDTDPTLWAIAKYQQLIDNQGNAHVRVFGYDDEGDDRTIRVDRAGNQYVIPIDSTDGIDIHDFDDADALVKDEIADHVFLVPAGKSLLLSKLHLDASAHADWEIKIGAGAGVAEITSVTPVADVSGSLDGKFFLLRDKDGIVAFWIDIDDSGTTEPNHDADRAVEITTIATGDTATVIAGKLITAIGADSQFSAAAGTGDEVLVTDAIVGYRSLAKTGDSAFVIAEDTAGIDALATLMWRFNRRTPPDMEFKKPKLIGSGQTLTISKTNRDNKAQSVYSMIEGELINEV